MPDSVYSADQFYAGQIGDFLGIPVPPEPAGLREPNKLLYASERTAELLRACYDLEVTGSPFIDDGEVWVMDKPRSIVDVELPLGYQPDPRVQPLIDQLLHEAESKVGNPFIVVTS